MRVTAYLLATRFVGLQETPGAVHNPAVLAMLQLVDRSVHDDETAWCSAFVHYIAWLLNLPRAKSLGARHWLAVGKAVPLGQALSGFDVVILSRGAGVQPGADVLDAPGHVGFFATVTGVDQVSVLGGNQSNAVGWATFPTSRVLGVRRLV